MQTIKIAGVPEHFNLPWHLCIANGEFEKNNINLQWIDVPEGTGKLCQMLRDKETDIAIILTEGIVKDIVSGNPSVIVQEYIETPLIWGIHVAAQSNYYTLSDLENKKAAISRLGSGSHLMAIVNAKKQHWDITKQTFEIVNTIHGAVESLTNCNSDYFMWEHFMTKPLVDQGVFRHIADCPTPWPCFVIAVRKEIITSNEKEINQILTIINNFTVTFKNIKEISKLLALKYNQQESDIKQWLNLTQWSQKQIDKNVIDDVQNQLFELKIIDKKITSENIIQ